MTTLTKKINHLYEIIRQPFYLLKMWSSNYKHNHGDEQSIQLTAQLIQLTVDTDKKATPDVWWLAKKMILQSSKYVQKVICKHQI